MRSVWSPHLQRGPWGEKPPQSPFTKGGREDVAFSKEGEEVDVQHVVPPFGKGGLGGFFIDPALQ